jgi:hypothetical protein
MDREKRIEKMAEVLSQSEVPLSGSHLAGEFGISRQAVVQDIALLRERGVRIMATARGYVMRRGSHQRIFAVRHTSEEIAEELNAIIEAGGRILDVVVDHPVYGEIRGHLDLGSWDDVVRFLNMLKSSGQSPLLSLSKGFHLHTVEAPDEETLICVEKALAAKGFLET